MPHQEAQAGLFVGTVLSVLIGVGKGPEAAFRPRRI